MAYSRPKGQLAHGELCGSHRYSDMTSVSSVRSDRAGHSVERPRSQQTFCEGTDSTRERTDRRDTYIRLCQLLNII